MVYRSRLDGKLALASVKDTSVSLAVGSHWIAAWDFGGRLYSMWKHGHTYRRGLNGRVLHKWIPPSPPPDALDPRGAGLPPPASLRRAAEASREGGRAGDQNPYDLRSRVHIDGASAHELADEAAGMLQRTIFAMEGDPSSWRDRAGRTPDARALELFRRCARFDARASADDAARFATVFAPVGILPPDQYLSIVLQATEGCSFGTCTFCDLYHLQYRVKPLDEFRAHAEAVRDYLGESALLRGRSVFLSAANALAIPMPRLTELFETIHAVFGPQAGETPAPLTGGAGLRPAALAGGTPAPPPRGTPAPLTGGAGLRPAALAGETPAPPPRGTPAPLTGGAGLRPAALAGGTPAPPPRGTPAPLIGGAGLRPAASTPVRRPVHAFVDGFTGLRKSADDYAALASLGLRRVYIGLESGHDPLLAFVRKPATRREAVETVRAIKAGGVSVGVIVMVGLGGRRFAPGHVADTTAAINQMGLDAGDLLYFSDLVEVPGTAYPQRARAEDVEPLALGERLDQMASIRDGLAFPGAPPRAARYDVREFVY